MIGRGKAGFNFYFYFYTFMAVFLIACEPGPQGSENYGGGNGQPAPLYKSATSEDIGVAIDIVLDNSGSMSEKAGADREPKYVVARAAILKMLNATDSFKTAHSDFTVKVALHVFSGQVQLVMPMEIYDKAKVIKVINSLPEPDGSTAIGDAMDAAREELYKSGLFRKNMLVITDGENTKGSDPKQVAHEIFERSEGGVGMYFVAFDTNWENLAFAKDVKGDVLSAQDATQLQKALNELYQGKILAEKVDGIEPGIITNDSSKSNTKTDSAVTVPPVTNQKEKK